MEFITKVGAADSVKADCIAVGVHADGELTASAKRIDAASKGAVRAAVKSGDVTGQRGSSTLLRAVPGVTAARVLLVGLGKAGEFTDKAYADATRAAIRAAGHGTRDLAIAGAEWHVKGRDAAWHARTLAIAARDVAFRSDELKSKRDGNHTLPSRVSLLLDKRPADEQRAAEAGLREGIAIANGMALAKRLGNLPGNVCTPRFLGDEAKKLAKELKLGVDVLDVKQLEKLGMGSFLSVAHGSDEPPRFIVLQVPGRGQEQRAGRAGRQGHHLRHRRHLAQARRGDGRDEVRHVRRGERARHLARPRRTEAEDQRGRHRARLREHAVGGEPSSRATSSRPCPARRSRSSTPTPRVA